MSHMAPAPADPSIEGTGLLWRDGVRLMRVAYQMVAYEERKVDDGAATAIVFTAVLRSNDRDAPATGGLGTKGGTLTLELGDGQRLACAPVEALSDPRRWIVRLTTS
jgi:hypothetical protein